MLLLRSAVLLVVISLAVTLGAGPAQAAGSPWRWVPSPNQGTKRNELSHVAAVSTTDAWAIGNSEPAPLVEHWNGKTWAIARTAAHSTDLLFTITAPSATNVTIGGQAGDVELADPIVLHYNGKTWTRKVLPLPTAPLSSFEGDVTAVSPTDVWVGAQWINPNGGDEYDYLEHWNGTRWATIQVDPVHKFYDTSVQMRSIDPISGTNVWFDTLNETTAGDTATVFQWTNGTLINRGQGPQVPAGQSSAGEDLGAIADTSASDVWAVGVWDMTGSPFSVYEPLAGWWNGTQWTSPALNFYPTDHWLSGIAVSSPTSVWVVGARQTSDGATYNLLEHWDGLFWQEWGGPNHNTSDEMSGAAAVPHSSQFWAVGQTGRKTMILHCCS